MGGMLHLNPDGTAKFRVWAPSARAVALRLGDQELDMSPVGDGCFELITAARPGDDYAFVLDGAQALPDPCSRWQPGGLRGPSRVFEPRSPQPFETPPLSELVIYELHVGAFTREGTFDAVIPHLSALAELGVSALELMPLAEFPGRLGWGYDGVYISAAQSSYGGPEALTRLVDAAHGEGLAVILDVVYNQIGRAHV